MSSEDAAEPGPAPPPGSLVMSVGLVAKPGASGPGQELRLASIAGAPDMVYPWPLTVGKGKIDEKNHDLFLILIHVMLQEV